MRLLEFMRSHAIDDETMASRIGDCSGHAVKKWKYGEREPDASTMLKIERVTDGKVTLRDWSEQSSSRPRRRQLEAMRA